MGGQAVLGPGHLVPAAWSPTGDARRRHHSGGEGLSVGVLQGGGGLACALWVAMAQSLVNAPVSSLGSRSLCRGVVVEKRRMTAY